MFSTGHGKSGMGLDSKVGRTKLLPCTAYTSEHALNLHPILSDAT